MSTQSEPLLVIEGLRKSFTLHLQDGLELPVFNDVDLTVHGGECVVLSGPSGAGKSSLLRCIYGNYLPRAGQVLVRHDGALVPVTGAEPRTVLEIRRRTMGYVSQFLHVIPRIPTIDLVMEPLLVRAVDAGRARDRAAELLARLNVPERLWRLPPATFSGGEQQRVNIARSFVADYPVLLLDEPTASLDAANRDAVVELINDARARQVAVVGIFHDADVRDRVATGGFDVAAYREAA